MSTGDHYVDASSNNRRGDLGAYARAGHKKISVKVSEGSGYHWFGGEDLIDDSHRLGLRVQHYHWLRPDQDAVVQAKFFLGWVGKRFKAGDDLMSDFELTWQTPDGSDAHRAEQLARFNDYVHARLGPLCTYTGNWYLESKGPLSQAECRRWPIVMSDYSGVAALPNPYGLHDIAWQYTDRARVAGWPDPVDYNRMLVAPTPPKPAPTPQIKPQEAGSMFEIIYNQATKIWYAWAPGYWYRFASKDDVLWAAYSGLCINGAAVKKVLAKPTLVNLNAFGISNAHTLQRRNMALGK